MSLSHLYAILFVCISDPIRDIVMFHTGGIVFLTIIINSTAMPKLVSMLGRYEILGFI